MHFDNKHFEYFFCLNFRQASQLAIQLASKEIGASRGKREKNKEKSRRKQNFSSCATPSVSNPATFISFRGNTFLHAYSQPIRIEVSSVQVC